MYIKFAEIQDGKAISWSEMIEEHFNRLIDEYPEKTFALIETSLPLHEFAESYYFENDKWIWRGAKPSFYHEWSDEAKAWVLNLLNALSDRKKEIDAERDKRINAPLHYDGKRFDADARARENLKSKLEEIRARETLLQPMPTEMLVWRDADNISHTLATQEAYKAWLEGFTIAMSERGTRLYAAAWQHKANIAALEDIDAILSYDVAAGWPT